MHVKYFVEHRSITQNDPSIEKALAEKRSEDELIEIGIQSAKKTKEEYENEQEKVTEASAQFSYILQNDAMIPYCDTIGDFYKEHIENAKLRERSAEKACTDNSSDYNKRELGKYTNKRKRLEVGDVCFICSVFQISYSSLNNFEIEVALCRLKY